MKHYSHLSDYSDQSIDRAVSMLNESNVPVVKMYYASNRSNKPKITNSSQMYELIKSTWEYGTIEYRETVKAALLNSNAECIGVITISEGGLTSFLVDIRIVMQAILLSNASGVILIHNHPSGNLNPSANDNVLTKDLKEACKLMNVRLLDHLIITNESYFSYQDNGQL